MNKYQEALYTLTDWFHSYKNEKGITVHERHITPKYEEAKKTIQELVDKETPRKPKEVGSILTIDVCPRCNSSAPSSKYIYCYRCGQKLDWSEEDE